MFRKKYLAGLWCCWPVVAERLTIHPETESEKVSGYEGVPFFPFAVMQTTWKNITIRDGTKVVATMWGMGNKRCSAEFLRDGIDRRRSHPPDDPELQIRTSLKPTNSV